MRRPSARRPVTHRFSELVPGCVIRRMAATLASAQPPRVLHAHPKEKNAMKIRVLIVASLLSLAPLAARAHCDTLDGPVVKTARTALDANEIEPVLAWVKPAHEREIRAAFRAAVDARKKSP